MIHYSKYFTEKNTKALRAYAKNSAFKSGLINAWEFNDTISDLYLLLDKKDLHFPTQDDFIKYCFTIIKNLTFYKRSDPKNKYKLKASNGDDEYNFEYINNDEYLTETEIEETDDYEDKKESNIDKVLKGFVDSIPEEQYNAIHLYYKRRLKLEEIRDVTGLSLGHLSSLINYGAARSGNGSQKKLKT